MDNYSGMSRSDAAAGFKSDSFYDRIGAGPLYKRKQIDTPQSDLSNNLNWLPKTEKFTMGA